MSLLTYLPDSWFEHVLTSMALPCEPSASKLNLQMYLVNSSNPDRPSYTRAMTDYALDIRRLRGPWDENMMSDLGQLLDAILPSLSGLPSKSAIANHECFADMEVRGSHVQYVGC